MLLLLLLSIVRCLRPLVVRQRHRSNIVVKSQEESVGLELRGGTKFVFVGGKGGVGKTSTSCAIGLQLAERGEKVLIVSTDPAHSVIDALLAEDRPHKSSGEPTEVYSEVPCLYAMEVDTELAMDSWRDALDALDVASIGKRYGSLAAEAAKGVGLSELKALASNPPPGIDELVGLAQVLKYRDEYDRIIIDTAPTGHALRLLALPEFGKTFLDSLYALKDSVAKLANMAGGALGTGAVAQDIDRALIKLDQVRTKVTQVRALLKNKDLVEFIAVALPTTLAALETERLVAHLESGIIRSLIVNKVCTSFTSSQARLLAKNQRQCITELKNKFHQQPNTLNVITVPFITDAELVGPDALRYLLTSTHLNAILTDLPSPQNQISSLLVVGGKGGVGKSTLAATLAVAKADQGFKTVLVSTDPAHSIGDALALDVVSPGILTPVLPNLDILEIDADAAALEAKQLLADAAFTALENRNQDTTGIAALVDALETPPPGVDELVALLKVLDLLRDKNIDTVVLDTAPTGHTLRLLQLPDLLDEFADKAIAARTKIKANPLLRAALKAVGVDISDVNMENGLAQDDDKLRDLQDRAFAMDAILHDPNRAEFIMVAAPNALSVAETLRLRSALQEQGIPHKRLLVNGLVDDNDDAIAAFANSLQHTQRSALTRLNSLAKSYDLRLTIVPQFDTDLTGRFGLMALGAVLFNP